MSNLYLPILITSLAGLSTVLGSLIVFFIKDFKKSYLSFFLGLSAGVMIYLSLIELLPEAIEGIGFVKANTIFFLGILFVAVIDLLVPHHFKSCKSKDYDKGLMRMGLMTALGIAIHNFPEGMMVFLTSFSDLRFGLFIALATALHNIPEGIAIVIPVLYATKNRLKALKMSFWAGIVEPIGGLVSFFVLQPFLTNGFISFLFAFIAGIMIYISLDELLPSCFKNCQGHTAITGIITGMLLMSVSLSFL